MADTTYPTCETCVQYKAHGRKMTDDVHCYTCHASWRGTEAQHCTACHTTFASISAADAHRWKRPKGEPNGQCADVRADDRWHEKRPNVWTNTTRPAMT